LGRPVSSFRIVSEKLKKKTVWPWNVTSFTLFFLTNNVFATVFCCCNTYERRFLRWTIILDIGGRRLRFHNGLCVSVSASQCVIEVVCLCVCVSASLCVCVCVAVVGLCACWVVYGVVGSV